MFEDCMIDLETLSTNPEAHILSIAAVMFDPYTGAVGHKLYVRLTMGDQNGAHVDPGTVQWWMNQSQAARDEVFAYGLERLTFVKALKALDAFLQTHTPQTLWQRGNIDSVWLERAYKRAGWDKENVPFHFGQWADQRTATRGHAKPPSTGTAHNALDDCLMQIEHLASALSKN